MMKRQLLILFGCLFSASVVLADDITVKVKVNSSEDEKTGTSLSAALESAGVSDYTSVTSLTVSGPLKDTDITILRKLTSMTKLDMAGVELTKELDASDAPLHPFITAVDSTWTTELGPVAQPAAVSYGIMANDQLPSHIFDGMKKLETVTLPAAVTSFGNYCFMDCEALTTVNNVSQVTDLGSHAFLWCKSLETFTIPDNVEKLEGTFMGCTNLTSVTFPDTDKLTVIGGSAFARCVKFNLTDGKLPAQVREVGTYAFFKCESLTKVELPVAGLTKLDGFAFEYCTALTQVDNFDKIHLDPMLIPYSLFSHDENLETLTFPSGITEIGQYAFNGCKKLSATIDLSTITTVRWDGFKDCELLQFTNVLPATMSVIESGAFSGCKQLAGDITYPEQANNTIQTGALAGTSITSVTIPASIKTIEGNVFENCGQLTTVTFADRTTEQQELTIGSAAFQGCETLATINFCTNLKITEVAHNAFLNCFVLPNATANRLIQDVTKLENAVFWACRKVTDLVIPASVTEIEHAFVSSADEGDNTVRLKTITVSAATAPTCVLYANKDADVENPFGLTEANGCQIIFTGEAADNVSSYYAQSEFRRILTKTLSEEDTEYNCVAQEHAIVELTRTLNTEGNWNSFVLPFAATNAQLKGALDDNALVALYHGKVDDVFRFYTTTGDIPAGKPVLVKITSSKAESNVFTFENVDLKSATPSIAPYSGSDYTFTGTFVKKVDVVPAGGYFVKDTHFRTNGTTSSSRGYRAWLQPTAPAPAYVPMLGFSVDGQTTYINDVQSRGDGLLSVEDAAFDLSGRRVEHPVKGVYVVNGRKVVIK